MRRGPAVLLSSLLLSLLSVTSAPAAPPTTGVAGAYGDGWVWPVRPARVVHGFDLPAQRWLPGHRGIDLAARTGGGVRAAGAGTVLVAGRVAGVPVVTIAHPGGLRTTYQPVAATVTVGDRIEAGDRIGQLLPTGSHCLPGACLHWGLLRGDDYLDPLLLVLPTTVRLLPLGDVSAPG